MTQMNEKRNGESKTRESKTERLTESVGHMRTEERLF